MFTIGQMAQLCQTSVQTLRLYDQTGLLPAVHKDPQTGYRYYQSSQIFQFTIIKYLQQSGLTLNQIQTAFATPETTLPAFWAQQEAHAQEAVRAAQRGLQIVHSQQRQLQRLQALKQHLDHGPYQQTVNELVITTPLTTPVTPGDTPDASVATLNHQLITAGELPNLEYSFTFPRRAYQDLSEIRYTSTFKTRLFTTPLPPQLTVRHHRGTFLCLAFRWDTTSYLARYRDLLAAAKPHPNAQGPVYERSFPLKYGQVGSGQNFLTELSLQIGGESS
ncbi:MerR family transcriptional regulator [Levilactobacillus zymae]|uniref:Transcriptional regulator, MerR family n=1 Tax=Levilactobacillus zymae TaxID=267363 RepID=A0A1Y6JXP9_9LACO|nr:MerR family transcriptional regulator [Levilactobacillus zymae]SMS13104.1 Transcriptional regulator, MerR family [Levilactobacillus zymae]